MLGRSANPAKNVQVAKEAEAERDILQVDMQESYNNLTLKTIHALR